MNTLIDYYLDNQDNDLLKGKLLKKKVRQNKKITNYMTKWQLSYKNKKYK